MRKNGLRKLRQGLAILFCTIFAFGSVLGMNTTISHADMMTMIEGEQWMFSTPWNVDAVRTYDTFTVPVTGNYKLEVWGASGGKINSDFSGHGGYAYGEITLTAGQKLYVYVGGRGLHQYSGYDGRGGWNGGGNGGVGNPGYWGAGGGGATDIRTVAGTWDNATSLNSRIIVAGGGGGVPNPNSDGSIGSSGGGTVGLNGYDDTVANSWGYGPALYGGKGGTQSAGGAGGTFKLGSQNNPSVIRNGLAGSFGKGAHANFTSGNAGGGGGGGYYGGGSGAVANTVWGGNGGGGSSYVSTSLRNRGTIPGNELMTHAWGYDTLGNDWDGYAKITFLDADKEPPVLTLKANVTTPTNGNITITANAVDAKSTVSSITLPNNTVVNGASATYTVSSNGTYTFKATDSKGNTGSLAITISNIDKTPPTAPTLSASTTAPTNQNVSVTVTYPADASVKQYKIGTGAWTNYTSAISLSTNNTVYARGQDNAGNWSAESSLAVNNIDKTAPNAPTFSANKTAPTNTDVTVTISYPTDGNVKQYKIGSGGSWTNYTSPVLLSANNTIFARTQDVAGNWSSESSYAVSNIDKVAPVITIGSYNTNPSNLDITVTASTNEGSLNATSHKFTENGSFEFVATDSAGNVTKRTVTITNIDKVAPVITIGSYNTNPTNQDITVTASTNEGNLNATSHTFTSNGSFEFIATDSAGNVTKRIVTISNIDKVAPEITVAPYNTNPTNQDITVTVSTNEGSLNATSHKFTENGSFEFVATDLAGNVTKRVVTITNIDKVAPIITIGSYNANPTNQDIIVTASTDKGSLNATSHKFTENGSFEFVATDSAGNVAKKTVTIGNIDKIAPNKPTLSASTTAWTNQNVSVTINFPADASVKQYKVGSGGTWANYTTAVSLSNNETVYVKGQDNAGNWSAEDSLVINNIDKTAPSMTLTPSTTAPTNQDVTITANILDSASGIAVKKWASGSQTANYFASAGTVLSGTTFDISANGTFTVYAKDNAGNETVKTITVSNIDKVLPVITIAPYSTAPTNQNLTVYASVNKGTLNAVSYTFAQNGSFEFVATDIAGNVVKKIVTISNIDKTAPSTPVLSADKVVPTNTDVKVSISYPTDAVVRQYKVGESGTWMTYSSPIVLSSNDTIYAKGQDDAGNWSFEGRLTVSNIDKIAPNAPGFTSSETAPTNKDVSVTINYPADGHVKQYRVGTGVWTLYTAPVVFSQDGAVYARTQDMAGNWSEVSSYTVNNIDKIAPTSPRVQVSNYNTLIINGSTDAKSGLAKYMYQLNGKAWIEYTGAVTLPDGQYGIVAKAVDRAGNETSVTLDYLVFKSALDEASRAVVKAEVSQLQADVETARPLVKALPNSDEKDDLEDRLIYVQGCIDKELLKQELTQIQNDIAEDKIVEPAQVEEINTRVTFIRMQAMALPKSVAVTDLNYQVSNVETESVATEKVIDAEHLVIQPAVDTAKTAVNRVKTVPVKSSLSNRLDSVQLNINGQDAVDKAKVTKSQNDIDYAWDRVSEMPDSDLKVSLQNELAKIDNKLKLAKEAVVKSEKSPSVRNFIIDADNKVKAVRDTVPEKPGLAQRVQDLKDAYNASLTNAEYQENLKQATHYTEQAEQYVTKYYIDKAQAYISALPEGDTNRVSLQARLDFAQGQYDTVVNPPVAETTKEVKEATKWVENSEKYRTAVYMNKAQSLVNALPDSSIKDALQERLNAIVPK